MLNMPAAVRYCEDKFINKYIGTIGVDYGVKPLKLGNIEVRLCLPMSKRMHALEAVFTAYNANQQNFFFDGLSDVPRLCINNEDCWFVQFGASQIRINMWDLAGGSDYSEIRSEFYKVATIGGLFHLL